MVASMTAFARQTTSEAWGTAAWEIRSVNHRHLDISLRLPEDIRSQEPKIRELISKQLKRGKIDCSLRLDKTHSQTGINLDEEQLQQLLTSIEVISLRLENPAPVSPLDVINWPGVQLESDVDAKLIQSSLLTLLESSLETLLSSRHREGEKLKQLVLERCFQAQVLVTDLRPQLPEMLNTVRERFLKRAKEQDLALDEGRLEQEMLLLAQKMDVAEELDRLDTHIAEVIRVLDNAEPVGRRLDFLMQEMNREANTLGSKSANTTTTNISVELKVLIEQMREQIQNIE